MPTVRTFIAVDLPPVVKTEIGSIIAGLKPLCASIRWVRFEGLHMTLKFLGEIPQEQLPDIFAATEKAALSETPFSFALAGMGAFPNLHRPRVLWVGVQDDGERLKSLQETVEGALVACGFPREQRAFSPHLTIGRVRSPQGIQAVLSRLPSISYQSEMIAVSSIKVMRSQLQPAGAVYSTLQTLSLGPEDT